MKTQTSLGALLEEGKANLFRYDNSFFSMLKFRWVKLMLRNLKWQSERINKYKQIKLEIYNK